ncbi:hypothetical protein Q3G72_029734 [Acer saccharum]|nr:hypothetical protein Q3G72_029734 [Acer saccharum]
MGKDPRPGSLQTDSIAPPPKRRALALKEMRMKVIQKDHAKGILWSKGIGKDRRVGKLSFLEKLCLPQSFAFFAVSGVVSSTPLFLLCCGIVD